MIIQQNKTHMNTNIEQMNRDEYNEYLHSVRWNFDKPDTLQRYYLVSIFGVVVLSDSVPEGSPIGLGTFFFDLDGMWTRVDLEPKVNVPTLLQMHYNANVTFVDGKVIKDRYNEPEFYKWEYPINFDYYEVVYWNENNRILMLKTKPQIQTPLLEQVVDIPQGYEKGELVGFKASDFGHGDVLSMPYLPMVFGSLQTPSNPNSICLFPDDISGVPFVDDDTLKERLMNNDDAVSDTVNDALTPCEECGGTYSCSKWQWIRKYKLL
jgi:hypothetical protein